MERTMVFGPAQYEVINAVSCLQTEEDIRSLKDVIVRFLNERLQKELNRLWANGSLSQEKLDTMGQEHLRTPYK